MPIAPYVIEFAPLHGSTVKLHVLFPTSDLIELATALGTTVTAHDYADAPTIPAICVWIEPEALAVFQTAYPADHVRPNFLKKYLEKNFCDADGSFDDLAARAVAAWEAATPPSGDHPAECPTAD
ncbi:hypothetical protein [Brevundimonas diminuta]|uniref:hypothetical protein n=1 Tax=Brevundimonas diminuta TaxID=293 RepID=UPI001376558D|nr:hypothetical protein [Brevundimonas diminuta]